MPLGEVIVVDGTMTDLEWRGAARLGGGAVRLALLEGDDFLQVGLQTPPLFVASLCVELGDEVHIFHASSAVGHARYVRREGAWDLVEGFEWRLRGAEGRGATAAEQALHMERQGWVANTVSMGSPGETELRISSRFLEQNQIRFALGLLLRGDGTDVSGWPMGPGEDGCTELPTIAGPLPARVRFDLDSWGRLKLTRYR